MGLTRTENVYCCAHLVQLLRTDVGAIREAKVDETPFSQQVLVGEGLVLVCVEAERSADVGSANLLVLEFFFCEMALPNPQCDAAFRGLMGLDNLISGEIGSCDRSV